MGPFAAQALWEAVVDFARRPPTMLAVACDDGSTTREAGRTARRVIERSKERAGFMLWLSDGLRGGRGGERKTQLQTKTEHVMIDSDFGKPTGAS